MKTIFLPLVIISDSYLFVVLNNDRKNDQICNAGIIVTAPLDL